MSSGDGLVDGIAAAVDGSGVTGLSQRAEELRSETTGFLAVMRR